VTKLSVNLNKIALLRNSRGQNKPDLERVALDVIEFGAQGITLHPRPDERHAKKTDVFDLKNVIPVELNVEGYPSEEFLKLIKDVKPAQCTLVPDPPNVLTSNAGWKVTQEKKIIEKVVKELTELGVRSSLFIDPYQVNADEMQFLAEINLDRIELYTERYARDYPTLHRDSTTAQYQLVALWADQVGIKVNAGHDLDLQNLKFLKESIPNLEEVSIGHGLICDALYLGFAMTIQRYLHCLR
jgi:pyridoxine 5-phosphate synthase